MIRHACAACVLVLALPILTLPVAMVEPSFGALLMSAIGTAPLIKSGLLATGLAAIALTTVTVRTQKEYGAAIFAQANSQPKHYFAVNRHAPLQAALDNGDHFVAT